MPNLPSLSSNRSMLPSSPSSLSTYQNGGESYREKIREKIQSTPRKSGEYTANKSIDLSMHRENTFRSASRLKNSIESDADMGAISARDTLKSARLRQIVFYNNNNTAESGNDNQENLNGTDSKFSFDSELNENNYLSRRKRFETNNFNQAEDQSEKFRERLKTAVDSSTRTPLVKPRKLLQNVNQVLAAPARNRSHDFSSNESNLLFGDEKRVEHPIVALRTSVYKEELSSSRSNLKQNSDVAPIPRKRDVSTKILTNESSDFRIKRVSSSKLVTPRSTYFPSPRIVQAVHLDTSNEIKFKQNNSELKRGLDKPNHNKNNLDFDSNLNEDMFSSNRQFSGGRRGSTRIEVGLEPKLELRNLNKSRHSYD